MLYCRFVHRRFLLVSFCCILLWGNFAQFAVAEVVQAYRPSDADLEWLLGDTPIPISNVSNIPNVSSPSDIIQAGLLVPSNRKSLTPQHGPCQPVRLPRQTVPPAPKIVDNKTDSGLTPEQDGIINISPSVIETDNSVSQMSGARLPPPTEVPRETNILALPARTPDKSASKPNHSSTYKKSSCSNPESDDSICICFTCLVSGNQSKTEQHCGSGFNILDIEDFMLNPCRKECSIRYVPNMIGGNAWFAGHNAGEQFNASAQNRVWAEYRHWGDAVLMDGEKNRVEQFSFGLEKKLLKKSSVELRVPLFYFGSEKAERIVELGNVSLLLKQVLRQKSKWTVSAGGGVALPTATSGSFLVNNDASLMNNKTYLVSFLGIQWHPNKSTFGHFVVQADLPFANDELFFDGRVIRTGMQLGHWIYRSDHGKRQCRFGLFAEVNYAEAQSTEFHTGKSMVTASAGMPMVFGKLTCTNSFTLPISDGERPFNVGYNFSLSRQF